MARLNWLIQQCRPTIVFGEQVASKTVEPWVDLVQADLEAMGYAFGAVPFPSAGVGAPHIRDRLFWVANAPGGGRRQKQQDGGRGDAGIGEGEAFLPAGSRNSIRLADTHGRDASAEREQRSGQQRQQPQDGGLLQDGSAGPVNGLWADADWLFCRDGKWRPVEPGTFPLAHGAASRVGRLRAYGNAINAEAATQFIGAYLDNCIGHA